MRRTSLAAVVALLLGLVTANNALAESAPGCGPVTQIGSTGYIGDNGQRWASVKQFKGCGKNWAYIYTWASVHGAGAPYTPEMIIIEKWASTSAREPFGHAGQKSGKYRQQELWSSGTDTLSVCTSAYAEWNSGAMTYRARSSIRC
ncbi:hypothetical protein SAMN05216553_12054 [Lentzea fradiae]|uniref:Peptidase inhibitor family I36 n=1 Tax=Lentzea fradiae TaxID=200378 RepID=A0A1G8BUA3_9PSEU|nr:hypothetical protein [Lentzea fradiae]SDH36688.1 hypothetical protein SAMN05216553_12054 [Lentzea fradiae]